MPIHAFKVELKCTGCANSVQKVLAPLGDQISRISVDYNNKMIYVTSDVEAAKLLSLIKQTGKIVEYTGVIPSK